MKSNRMMLHGIRTRLLGLIVATVVPFVALIGAGLWIQWRIDQAQALKSALTEARLLAAEVDDQIGNVESLLAGLSRAVSTRPADTAANDAVLRKVKTELPAYVSNILVFSLDGHNIGTSWGAEGGRIFVGDRDFFRQILNGRRLAIGEPVRGRTTGNWVVAVARPVEDGAGQLGAVILVGILLEHFQDALRVHQLPAGSVVRILNEKGIVLGHSVDGPSWIARDLSTDRQVARHMAAKQISETVRWPDDIERITGSATARQGQWLVSIGLPVDIGFANVVSRLIWGTAAGITALLLALGLAWAFSGRIIGPLQQLSKDASALAGGDLGHRSSVRTQDEVGELAKTFNTMAASLEGRHRELNLAHAEAASEAVKRAQSEEMERQAKETLAAVIDASPVAIVCSDPERRMVLWSRAAEQIFGYAASDVLGRPTQIVPPEGKAASQLLFDRAVDGETIRDIQTKRMRKDGSLIDVRIAAAPMYHSDGTVRGVAWAYEDITHRKKSEEQLERLAHYDQLTSLPNRLTLQKQLGRLLAAERPTSIALFDLDGFKDVNDTLGHSVGDELLVEVGRRLSELAEGRGAVCRLGGDEFVVIIPDCGDPRVIADIADRMLKRLAEPFEINDHVLHLAGSAGIAIAPNDGPSVDELLANADLALYRAKSEGGRIHRLFLPVFRAQAQARRALDGELRRALEENEFELFFQPQVRIEDTAVVGAEALLRWRHPVRGVLAPAAFIETLAESSIASDVGKWIIRTACEKTSTWRAAGLSLERIAVNLFRSQFSDKHLPDDIEEALRATGLPAEVLELEITESIALKHEDAAGPLQKLHTKGVKLAFDDFGTGYASLSYLIRFPLARIKIDRSFIMRVTEDMQNAAIVRSLIAMAHNLGLAVIAEGVETEAQAEFLLNERCEEAQGYFYAKPLPAGEFENYLRTRRLAVGTSGAVAQRSGHRGSARRRKIGS